jgi:hypothetical protein
MIRQNAMEFDNEDNDSFSRTMELPTGESLNHGKKRLSSNMGPSLHVPKVKSKIMIPSESTSPTMHENGVPRASSTPLMIVLVK